MAVSKPPVNALRAGEGRTRAQRRRAEAERLQDLRQYNVLDTPPEESFDRLTRLAARYFDVPIALVSLVDATRQWPKACYGVDLGTTDREISFCHYAIRDEQPMVVEDTREDPRFADAAFVTGPPHLHFYAGAPLVTPSGNALGTFCLMGHEPHTLSEEARSDLRDFAAMTMDEMELRREAAASARARAALAESEERHRALVERASDVMAIIGKEGTVVYQSPSSREVLGRAPQSIVGKSLGEIGIHPDDVTGVLAAFSKCLVEPDAVVTVGYRVRDDAGNWMHLESTGRNLLDDPAVEGVVANTRDVTDSLRYEAERAARQRAEELLETKTTLLNNVSHELRTPLAAITGFAEVLAEDEVDVEEQREFAHHISQSSKRLQNTLESVLALAHLEGGKASLGLVPARTDLAAVTEQVAGEFRAAAERKGLGFEVTLPDEAMEVLLNEEAFRQVLDNLVANAVKFTEEGNVRVRAERGNGEARVRVEDTGIGIGKAFRETKLFDDFAQESAGLSRSHGGSGLGLSIAKQLTEHMGGTLEVESEKGRGSTFTACFPLEENRSGA